MRFVNAVLIACLMFGLVAFVGCGKEGDGTADNGEGEGQNKKLQIAFVVNTVADFWIYTQRGIEKSQTVLPGYECIFRMNDEGTAAGQIRIVDDLIASGVAAIAFSPIDPVNQIKKLNEWSKKIKVICCDSDIPKSNRLCYLGTNNVSAGEQAGQLIKEALGDAGGKVMVFVGRKDVQNAIDRLAGIQKVLKGTNIEIVDVRTDDGDRVKAKANVLDTLTSYPEVNCMVSLWSYNGTQIVNACKEKKLLGKMKIVCFDEDNPVLEAVKDGYVYGTVVQQPFEFGYQSMTLLADILEGDMSRIPENKQIIIDTKIIKQADAAAFQAFTKAIFKNNR